MVDFIAEIHQKPSQLIGPSEKGWWILHINGASWVSGFGVGFFLQSQTGEQLEQAIWLEFSASNNEASMRPSYSDWTLLLLCQHLSSKYAVTPN